MNPATSPDDQAYLTAFRGSFIAALRWPQLDGLWEALREQARDDWYVYAVGEQPPAVPASRERLLAFVTEIDRLLRAEHDEDYCGIVYADDLADPTLVKVYDPNHLGSSCSHGAPGQYPPRWIFSLDRPEPLDAGDTVPHGRRRWWQRFFGAPSAR